jgi:O-antigen biosynthesis protein WbqP
MYNQIGKRSLDIILSLIAILLIGFFSVSIILFVKLFGVKKIIYKQDRVGKDNKIFTMYKFRTMPVGTPNKPSRVAKNININIFQKFLRRTNLDELPQLFNVLLGNMSLIGPRPAIVSQKQLLRLRNLTIVMTVKPGITGLAQINSYDNMEDEKKVKFDEEYAKNISLSLDFMIILKTINYLFKPPPVY